MLFQPFNKSTRGETPGFLDAEIADGRQRQAAKDRENALRSQNIMGGAEIYKSYKDMQPAEGVMETAEMAETFGGPAGSPGMAPGVPGAVPEAGSLGIAAPAPVAEAAAVESALPAALGTESALIAPTAAAELGAGTALGGGALAAPAATGAAVAAAPVAAGAAAATPALAALGPAGWAALAGMALMG